MPTSSRRSVSKVPGDDRMSCSDIRSAKRSPQPPPPVAVTLRCRSFGMLPKMRRINGERTDIGMVKLAPGKDECATFSERPVE